MECCDIYRVLLYLQSAIISIEITLSNYYPFIVAKYEIHNISSENASKESAAFSKTVSKLVTYSGLVFHLLSVSITLTWCQYFTYLVLVLHLLQHLHHVNSTVVQYYSYIYSVSVLHKLSIILCTLRVSITISVSIMFTQCYNYSRVSISVTLSSVFCGFLRRIREIIAAEQFSLLSCTFYQFRFLLLMWE